MGKKMLVVSDNHGSRANLKKVIKEWGDRVDAFVHCGDSMFSDEGFKKLIHVPVYLAEGNCDFRLAGPKEALFEFEGHVCFVTHGHRYSVSWGDEDLLERALELGADLVFYGHTHIPAYRVYEDEQVTLFNPGSLDRPRQYPPECTFLIVEFMEDGKVVPSFYSLK